MPTSFTVTTPAVSIALGPDLSAEFQVRIANTSGFTQTARTLIESATPGLDAQLLAADGSPLASQTPEVDIRANEEVVYRLRLAARQRPPAGTYRFSVLAVNTVNPNADVAHSQSLSVVVGQLSQPMPLKPWMIFAAVAALIVLGGATALILAVQSRTVPSLVGSPFSTASSRLAAAHLRLGTVTYQLSDADSDAVVGQNPAAGAALPPTRTIDLILARPMPSVVALPLRDAQRLLVQLGVREDHISSTEVPDPSRNKNLVLSQDPPAGARVPTDKLIALKVAANSLMPRLINLPLDAALEQIQDAGLAKGSIDYKYAPLGDNNTVADQDPAPRQVVATGQRINLTVVRKVPNVIGAPLAAVAPSLAAAELKPGKVSYELSDADPDLVVSQTPLPGAPIPDARLVNLTLATAMPDLTGKSRQQALARLDELGWGPEYITIQEQASGSPPGTVIEQKPAAKARVAASDKIVLTLAGQAPDIPIKACELIATAQPPIPVTEAPISVLGGTAHEFSVKVETGTYHLYALFTAAESRPCKVLVKGALKSTNAFATVTGSWTADRLTTSARVDLGRLEGLTTIKVMPVGSWLPHFYGYVVSTKESLTLSQADFAIWKQKGFALNNDLRILALIERGGMRGHPGRPAPDHRPATERDLTETGVFELRNGRFLDLRRSPPIYMPQLLIRYTLRNGQPQEQALPIERVNQDQLIRFLSR